MDHNLQDYLTTQDLKVIRSTCWEARNKWMDIGIELDLKKDDLDALQGKYKDDVDKCFTGMLHSWLGSNPRPKLTDLITALKHKTVNSHVVAEELETLRKTLKRRRGAATESNTLVSRDQAETRGEKSKQETKYAYCTHNMSYVIVFVTAFVALFLAIVTSFLFNNGCHMISGGKGLKMALEGERPVVILFNVDRKGKLCSTSLQTPTCWLESKISGKSINCTITEMDDNLFEVSYKATSRGRHQLHIKVEGKHIKGSPFNVTVIMKMPLKMINGLKEPLGVAVNRKGEIFIAERRGRRISIFNSTTDKIDSFGSNGSKQGWFPEVYGVAVDSDGNVLATDCTKHRIYKFSPKHQPLKSEGSHGNNSLQFDGPLSIGISPTTKRLAIPEWENHRIQILNPDLTFYKSFGGKGSDNGQFLSPHDVAFDSTGNMYVTDAWNHRIQVFNPEGKYLQQFGKWGTGDGELNFPAGIYIDSDGIVYVVEVSNHRISMFTHKGKFLTSFGSEGDGPGQFNKIYRITVDGNGMIYISDSKNNRLQIF